MAAEPSAQAITAKTVFKKKKVFHDPIHSQIPIHPVCVRIIDTPQFQRLRHIKQLDICYLVYPGASHNRFEHSIGVCHLAGKLLRTIKEHQPDEDISERDILCVEIAGLCHDLGQAPFSHVYEERFMPKLGKPFTHENAAKMMFKYMLEVNKGEVKNDIQKIIAECEISGFHKFDDEDFIFIEEMIGDHKINGNGFQHWPYKGRGKEKSYMYEIVANKRNGVDVDKWDYLARDSYMLGVKINFDHSRLLESARVLEVSCTNGNGANGGNGQAGNGGKLKQICYRDKDAQDLYDMFYSRMLLHRRVYQHETHNIIGMMICDVLCKANETFLIYGKKFSEMVGDNHEDLEAYTQFTDDFVQVILYSPKKSNQTNAEAEAKNDSELEDVKTILSNILKRKLYKCVAQTQSKAGEPTTVQDFKEELNNALKGTGKAVQENLIDLDIVHLNYGMDDKDPMDKVRFYNKDNIDVPLKLNKIQVSYVLPGTFEEHIVRVYCKTTDVEIVQMVRQEFTKWCINNNYPLPMNPIHDTDRTSVVDVQDSEEQHMDELEDLDEFSTVSQEPHSSQVD